MFKFPPSPPCSAKAAALALLGVLATLPFAAQAQVYKCHQAGGGTVFQSSPCPGSIKPAAPAPSRPAKAESPEPFYDPYAQKPNEGQRAALELPRPPNAAVQAHQKQRCDQARHNLEVLSSGKPAYLMGNNNNVGGQHHILNDNERAREATTAREAAEQACR